MSVTRVIAYLADYPALIEPLAQWHWQQWGPLRPGDSPRAIAFLLRACCGRQGLPCTLIALDGGQLLGSATVLRQDMGIRAALSPWLAGLWVRPDARRTGMGARLVHRAEAEAAALGHANLYLYMYTEDAEAFYQRLGWQCLERCSYRGKDVSVTVRALAKRQGH